MPREILMGCIACLEYNKDLLTDAEFEKNKSEFGDDVEHDQEALDKHMLNTMFQDILEEEK